MAPLLEKFRRDIAGILWMATAVFLAMALASFHATDPSFNSVSFGSSPGVVKNLCGYFGSFLSDILYQLLGFAAWVIVAACARVSVLSFRGQAGKFNPWRLLWSTLLVTVISSLFSLYFPTTRLFGGHVSLGGALGVVVSQGLISAFNKVGVAIILWSAAAVLLVFFTEKRLFELFPWAGGALRGFVRGVLTLKDRILVERRAPERGEALPEPEPLPQPETQMEKPVHRFSLKEMIRSKKETVPPITPTGSLERGKTSRLRALLQQTPKQIENWSMPSLELLNEPPMGRGKIDEREITRNAKLVEQKLGEFDVTGQVVEVKPGPAVTMYEFRPAASVKINEITKLADDLSLALSAESLRIIAPIPGRDVVGIETSNSRRDDIFMKELMESDEFWSDDIRLPVAVGKSVSGDPKIVDLRKLPHLLVAGTTGSGKSVFIMSLVTSLIMRHSPKTLRLVLVDPKQVDLAAFHKIPHLLLPPVKDARPAVNTLKWLIREMEKRYRAMSKFNAKNIEGFNAAVAALKKDDLQQHEERNRELEATSQGVLQSYYFTPQPYIVAVIEEFADLMSVDRNGVEPAVVRLAQMARASGIHLVLAMQSPRREVLTGLIKTNFPGRISFKVASKVDSSIILDQRGAERLLSVGDMLYLAPGVSQPQRYHGAFLRDEEMTRVTEFWMKQGDPQFEPTAVKYAENTGESEDVTSDRMNPDMEEGYDEVVAFVSTQKEVSASLLQRRFRFGYPKAARIIELLESEGVVGPANGSKPRHVLVNKLD